MNVYDPLNFSVLLGGSVAEWPSGRVVWASDLKFGDPEFGSRFDWIPDWIRDSSPRLRLCKANWSASCQLGFLTR